jgi:hypothetical protein
MIGLLLEIASRLAPMADKPWVEEMGFEAAFIPGRLRRYGWVLGTLRFALMRRITTLRWRSTPGRTALATSLAIAAVVGFSVFFPQTFRNPLTPGAGEVVEQQSLPEAKERDDESRSRRQELAATPLPSAGAPTDSLADSVVPSALGEVSEETVADDFAATTAEAMEPSAAPERALAQAALPNESSRETVAPPDGDALEMAQDQAAQQPSTPRDVTSGVADEVDRLALAAERIEVTVVSATRLKVTGNSSGATGEVLLDREVEPGETFTYALPVRLFSDDAGAITITANGVAAAPLGNTGVAVERLFTKATDTGATP